MAITTAEILVMVIEDLGSAAAGVATIDRELLGVLRNLSARPYDFLTTTGTMDTVANTASYEISLANFKREIEVMRDESDGDDFVMRRVPFRQYQKQRSTATGKPKKYAIWNDALYLLPTPDGVYTINFDYTRYHPTSLTTILFADQHREMIAKGVVAELLSGVLSRQEGAAQRWQIAVAQYEAMIRIHGDTQRTPHNDIRRGM